LLMKCRPKATASASPLLTYSLADDGVKPPAAMMGVPWQDGLYLASVVVVVVVVAVVVSYYEQRIIGVCRFCR
jgi:hypothetical protein